LIDDIVHVNRYHTQRMTSAVQSKQSIKAVNYRIEHSKAIVLYVCIRRRCGHMAYNLHLKQVIAGSSEFIKHNPPTHPE